MVNSILVVIVLLLVLMPNGMKMLCYDVMCARSTASSKLFPAMSSVPRRAEPTKSTVTIRFGIAQRPNHQCIPHTDFVASNIVYPVAENGPGKTTSRD